MPVRQPQLTHLGAPQTWVLSLGVQLKVLALELGPAMTRM